MSSHPEALSWILLVSINLIIGTYQEEIYNYFEEIEENKEKQRRKMSRGK